MTRLPLRVRHALVIAVLASVTTGVLGLALYRMLEGSLLREVDGRLAESAHQMRELIAQTPTGTGAPGGLGEPLSSSVIAPGIVAKRITPDGQAQILAPPRSNTPFPDAPALIAAGRAGQTTTDTVQAGPDGRLRLLVTPVANAGETLGVLVVGESLAGMQDILAHQRTLLLLAGTLMTVLITGGVALVTSPVLTAISGLIARTADIVASENYRNRVALPARRDEIHQLSVTINDLVGAVQRTLDQQRQFLAFTSHELRSPLTVILANLDLLRRDLSVEERVLSVADAMEEATRMRRLVNDLLLLAEKDSTRVIERAPIRLDSLIEETVAVTARLAETHTIRVDVAAPVVVEGDPGRLTQIVRNLVENALIHTPVGTSIEVRLEQVDGCAQITVADNGAGIATEHLPHLWDRFFRVDMVRSRAQNSTGLGLPIVEYIAEAHGGSVTVSSTPGQGTTFTVVLPLAPQTERITPADVATA